MTTINKQYGSNIEMSRNRAFYDGYGFLSEFEESYLKFFVEFQYNSHPAVVKDIDDLCSNLGVSLCY